MRLPIPVIRQILKEPLLHFLLLGSLLFALYSMKNDAAESSTLVVSKEKIIQLETLFESTWKRKPDKTELKTLIDNFVLDEIYYREALMLGLDQNDVIIKRRLKQKLEFISADMMSLLKPSDEQLSRYLHNHQDKFRQDAMFSFRQIYINPDKHDDPQRVASDLLAELTGLQMPDEYLFGDATMLPEGLTNSSSRNTDRLFGNGFSNQFDGQAMEQWVGPMFSSFGLHLIYLESKQDARLPELDEIRGAVVSEWTYDKQQSNKRLMDDRFRENYLIVIDWPEPTIGLEKQAAGSD